MHMKSIMLCYNLKGTKKGRKIGMLGSFLGFRVKYVEKEEYSKTIGVLTGLKEEVAEEASREETSGTDNEKNEEITDFEEEFLRDGYREVLCYGIAFYKKNCKITVEKQKIES